MVYAEEEEWDAGLIEDTLRLLQHDFRIINSSSDTCRVLRIDRTCGCIRATADRDEILPGDTAVVNMVVELDNSPYIDKEIYVYLSLQKEPVTLYITAIRGLSDQKIQNQFHYPLGENLRALGMMIVPPFLEQGKTCGAFTNIVNAPISNPRRLAASTCRLICLSHAKNGESMNTRFSWGRKERNAIRLSYRPLSLPTYPLLRKGHALKPTCRKRGMCCSTAKNSRRL